MATDEKTYTDHTPAELAGDEFTIEGAMSFLIDLEVVSDYANEFGEPGYHLAEGAVFAIGDWWCRDRDCEYTEVYEGGLAGQKKVHGVELHYAALFAKLEEAGVETAFDDEWMIDHDGEGKAYRTEADSYQWQPQVQMTEDGEWLTPDSGIEPWIEWANNDHTRCLFAHTWTNAEIEAQGFEEIQCGYENGWHPHQNDDPEKIATEMRRRSDEPIDVMFQISSVGQFDIHFCVWRRVICPECREHDIEVDVDGNTCNDCGHEWGQEDESDADDEA